MDLVDPSDVVSKLEDRLRRRSKFLLVLLAAMIAFGIAAAILESIVNFGEITLWTTAYLTLSTPPLVAFILWAFRRDHRRLIAWVRTLQPRIREASLARRSGALVVVFDNGLVAVPQANVLSFWILSSPGGLEGIRGAEEVSAWLHAAWRLKTVGLVDKRRGPQDAREALEALRNTFGSRWARASVLERSLSTLPDSKAPLRAAILSLFDSKWAMKADRILGGLDAVSAFLGSLRTMQLSPTKSFGPSNSA